MPYEDVKNLNKIMQDLNEAMAKVGRPFGHRVDQAIKKYMGCYPGEFNDALSDQIEMKILPKLNGLDGQAAGFNEVINKLEDVIARVEDAELLDAFTQACKEAADSFFKWRGVMR
jgi:myo-inositol-1-phosphate synthase